MKIILWRFHKRNAYTSEHILHLYIYSRVHVRLSARLIVRECVRFSTYVQICAFVRLRVCVRVRVCMQEFAYGCMVRAPALKCMCVHVWVRKSVSACSTDCAGVCAILRVCTNVLVCMRVRICLRLCLRMRKCSSVRETMSVSARVWVRASVYQCVFCEFVPVTMCVCVCVCVCTKYTHVCRYLRMRVCTCTHVRPCSYVCMRAWSIDCREFPFLQKTQKWKNQSPKVFNVEKN